MIECPNCGKNNSDDNKFCGECGSPLPKPKNYCPVCNIIFKTGEKFCTKCGTKLIVNENEEIPLREKLFLTFDQETIGLASRYLEISSLDKNIVIPALIDYLHTEEAINRAIDGQRRKEEYFKNNPK